MSLDQRAIYTQREREIGFTFQIHLCCRAMSTVQVTSFTRLIVKSDSLDQSLPDWNSFCQFIPIKYCKIFHVDFSENAAVHLINGGPVHE